MDEADHVGYGVALFDIVVIGRPLAANVRQRRQTGLRDGRKSEFGVEVRPGAAKRIPLRRHRAAGGIENRAGDAATIGLSGTEMQRTTGGLQQDAEIDWL